MARADVPASPTGFSWSVGSPTSSTGTVGPFACANANVATFTFTTGGGATYTVKTAADGPFSAAYTTATAFGTNGVITNPSANTQSSGSIGNTAVQYVEATYTGNTGTIAGTFTCSASQSQSINVASIPPFSGTITSMPPIQCASPSCAVHDSAPVQPSPIYTQPVQQPTPFGATPCPGASIAAAECASPAPYATSVSPAPGNLLARGYNASGAAAPVICTKSLSVTIAATTQSTETVMVPSASGKTTYVCLVLMSAVGTVAGQFGLASSATNTCGSLSNVLPAQVGLAAAPSNVALGTGVGVIASTPSGTALCFFNSTVGQTGTAQATIMYEQFLHSLTPEQYEEFCSLPKRCVLYGLMKHLSNLFDREVDAPLGVRP